MCPSQIEELGNAFRDWMIKPPERQFQIKVTKRETAENHLPSKTIAQPCGWHYNLPCSWYALSSLWRQLSQCHTLVVRARFHQRSWASTKGSNPWSRPRKRASEPPLAIRTSTGLPSWKEAMLNVIQIDTSIETKLLDIFVFVVVRDRNVRPVGL